VIQELENYANSKRESLAKSGIKIGVRNAKIRPNLFKLNITLETNDNVADFTVWDKGPELPVEAEFDVLNVLSRKTTSSKYILPKQSQELIAAFDELTKLLAT
jgi:hypothetical protein